jgi:hypothetical protein
MTDGALEFTGQYDATQRNFDRLGPAVFAPVPQARVYNNADISVANTTSVALTFNSERWDEGDLHSTSSNTSRLTAPVAGLYVIGGHVRFEFGGLGGFRQATIRLNGSTVIAEVLDTAVNTPGTGLSPTTTYRLAAGDYVELVVQQNSGGALNVDAQSNFSPEFWMARLAGFTAQVFD